MKTPEALYDYLISTDRADALEAIRARDAEIREQERAKFLRRGVIPFGSGMVVVLKPSEVDEALKLRAIATWEETPEPAPDLTRCCRCGWTLGTDPRAGCVEGNCSYRPSDGHADYYRMRDHKCPRCCAMVSP